MISALTKHMTALLYQKDVIQASQLVEGVQLMSCKADPDSLHYFLEFCYSTDVHVPR